jgi:death-on-curing protein
LYFSHLLTSIPKQTGFVLRGLYHVFVDGNKRTAITTLEYFLFLNGHQLTATIIEREHFVVKIAATHPDLAEAATWIQAHSY